MSSETINADGIRRRLEKGVRMIEKLAERRLDSGDPSLGTGIERMIIERELGDLAREIHQNPGPLAPYLERMTVRRRWGGGRD